MQNEEVQNMDLYIPRKCSATNRLITSKDHASVQINIGHLDDTGRYTGQFSTFALCGFIRVQALYFCVPFCEQLLEYYSNNKSLGEADENLLTYLADLFSKINSLKKKTD